VDEGCPALGLCQGNGGQDFLVAAGLGQQAVAAVIDSAAALEGDRDPIWLPIDESQARGQRGRDLLLVTLLQ
jgi:hypothetical protein